MSTPTERDTKERVRRDSDSNERDDDRLLDDVRRLQLYTSCLSWGLQGRGIDGIFTVVSSANKIWHLSFCFLVKCCLIRPLQSGFLAVSNLVDIFHRYENTDCMPTMCQQVVREFLPSVKSQKKFKKFVVNHISSWSVNVGDCVKVSVEQSQKTVAETTNDGNEYANVRVSWSSSRP